MKTKLRHADGCDTKTLNWKVFAAARELFGEAHTLLMRDMSLGNDVAVKASQKNLVETLGWLEHESPTLLSSELFTLLHQIAQHPTHYRDPSISWPILDRVKRYLRGTQMARDGFDTSFGVSPTLERKMKHIVVSVGANIGIGDEFLVAAILSRRVAEIGCHTFSVSTRQPELWRIVSKNVKMLQPPPFGGLSHIESLNLNCRAETGFIFLDFVDSDPFTEYVGPAGLLFTSSLIMGERRADWKSAEKQGRIAIQMSHSAPENREIELRYLTSRLLPDSVDLNAWRPPTSIMRTAQTKDAPIFLQCLTSKNNLFMPPTFWAETIAQTQELLAKKISVIIAPGPTPSTKMTVEEHRYALQSKLGANSVDIVPKAILTDIYNQVKHATALIGPDTFSSHFAAHLGVPQVTLILPPHLAWMSVRPPIFFVEQQQNHSIMSKLLARRLALCVGLKELKLARELCTAAEKWCEVKEQTWRAIDLFLATGHPIEAAPLKEWCSTLHGIYEHHLDTVEKLLGCRYEPRVPACLTFDPHDFDDPTERSWAAIRWLCALTLNELDPVMQLCAGEKLN